MSLVDPVVLKWTERGERCDVSCLKKGGWGGDENCSAPPALHSFNKKVGVGGLGSSPRSAIGCHFHTSSGSIYSPYFLRHGKGFSVVTTNGYGVRD